MARKDFKIWRLVIYVLGLISVLISVLFFLELKNITNQIFVILGAILLFDGFLSIMLQVKDGILFQLGRLVRIAIAIYLILFGFSFAPEKTMFISFGVIAMTFGVVGKIPKRNIRLDVGKKPVSTQKRGGK